MRYLIGIDIGGTKCAAILGSYEAATGQISILERIAFATEVQKGPQYTLDIIYGSIDELISKNGVSRRDIEGIGISCGGPLDSRRGIILSPPNLIGWDEIHIVEMIEEKFGIRTKLQNDANACGLAEWRFGAARGCNNVVFLTFGTGMGAGLILDGRLYSGTNDMAGEVGHVRLSEIGPVGYGKAGSFEGFCSGGGIAQLARLKVLEKLQSGQKVSFCRGIDALEELTAKAVAEAAYAGDELAKEIYQICGSYLGKGLSILIDVLNPEMVVIGSVFARSSDLIWPAALKEIEKESLVLSSSVCKVVPAALGDKIGDYAALAVGLEK